MSEAAPDPAAQNHHIRPMAGRDPNESHRAATPLELFFDLTFVLSFGFAAAQYAHALAEGHYTTAFIGFAFASFAICWAWINFSWFASAYDTDDWIYRLVTMVLMTGVLVFAIGLPRMFAALEHGGAIDTRIMVMGYVVMRIAMVFHWLRAARQNPERRRACIIYAASISSGQVAWVIWALTPLPLGLGMTIALLLILYELAGPIVAERLYSGTPWHPHHIAERYGLFAIIALGEGLVGTVATISAVVQEQGWSLDALLVCLAGTGLTFGMWWVYFLMPSAAILARHRGKAFVWGYGHVFIFTAIVATGAGLHVAANHIEGTAHIGPVAALLAVAIPVSLFLMLVFALYTYMIGRFDPMKIWLVAGTASVVALSLVAAQTGVGMAICLVILMFAPVVTVCAYEFIGHRHEARQMKAVRSASV